ncbi:hypothetical protein [Microvirga sp. M2]|uniref:hypothetical protein n=1 Tax=Microvirga sp. M2 TaxID=3073270 RepID=UPI0039C41A1C
MTDDEVEAVAQELAKVGGSTWYPGRTTGPLLRAVSERYLDRARVAIAALDRFRAAANAGVTSTEPASSREMPVDRARKQDLQVGTIVVYRPPGDQRAIACRIERIEAHRAYLVPVPQSVIGWVSLENLQPVSAHDVSAAPGDLD